jgi:RNA-binding protein
MPRDPSSAVPRPSDSAPVGKRLTGTERKALRARAHDLKPLVQIGQKGLSAATLAEIELGLEKHELIKIRLASDRDERKQEASGIAAQTGAAIVGTIGRILILYRPQTTSTS